jgi:hypothetical protein
MHLPRIAPDKCETMECVFPLVNSGAIISDARDPPATHHECSSTHTVLETMTMRSVEAMTLADSVAIALDMTEWMEATEYSQDPESSGVY